MNLLNPSVGDLCDRLTILALKRLHGAAAGKDVSHFTREWAGLLTKIHGRTLNGAWFEHLLELGAVNAELWTLTDELRDSLDSPLLSPEVNVVAIAKCGLEIMRMNDRRAALIQTINELCGDADGREKL